MNILSNKVDVKYESDQSRYNSDTCDEDNNGDEKTSEEQGDGMPLDESSDVNDDSSSENDYSSDEYESGSDDATAENLKSEGNLSNVLRGILSKRPKGKDGALLSSAVMAKAKTERQISDSKHLADDSSNSEHSEDDKQHVLSAIEQRKKRTQWEEMFRVKPDILNRDFERNLQKIATRGVVQLFNAVRKQQKIVDTKVGEAGKSLRRKDNVMASITKGDFLDVLQGQRLKSTLQQRREIKVEPKVEPKEEPTWDQMSDSE